MLQCCDIYHDTRITIATVYKCSDTLMVLCMNAILLHVYVYALEVEMEQYFVLVLLTYSQ